MYLLPEFDKFSYMIRYFVLWGHREGRGASLCLRGSKRASQRDEAEPGIKD